MQSLPLSLVVHQEVVECGGRLGRTAVVAAPATARASCEAEGGLEAGVEGVAVQRGAGHERRALRPEGDRHGVSGIS